MSEVRPKQLTVYYSGECYFTEVKQKAWQRDTSNLKKGGQKNTGTWGAGSQRKFLSRCLWMADNKAAKHLKWITITYRDNPTPDDARRNMNAMLQWMRRKGMKNYAWGLEVGKEGGRLHYHMLADVPYVPVAEYEKAWGRIRGDYSGNSIQLEAVKHEGQASQYASKMNDVLCETVKAAYASKGMREQSNGFPDEVLDYLDKFRLWATSSELVGKEKYSTKEENVHISQVIAANQFTKYETETGIIVYRSILSSNEKRKLIELIEVLNFREEQSRKDAVWRRELYERKKGAQRAQVPIPL